MANLRMLKKEIDYRLEELVFDCDMAICFQPTKEKEIFEVMQEGVALRNALFVKANNPADAHNPSLVRKHFAALRREIEAAGGGCRTLAFDIRDEAACHAALDGLERIDLLVNNAGLAAGFEHLDRGSTADWNAMIDTNVKGLL